MLDAQSFLDPRPSTLLQPTLDTEYFLPTSTHSSRPAGICNGLQRILRDAPRTMAKFVPSQFAESLWRIRSLVERIGTVLRDGPAAILLTAESLQTKISTNGRDPHSCAR